MGNQKWYASATGQLCDHRQDPHPLNVVKCNMSKVAAENFEVISNADILFFQFGNRMSYSSSSQTFCHLGLVSRKTDFFSWTRWVVGGDGFRMIQMNYIDFAAADLTGGRAQGVRPVMGSSSKYRWSFACSFTHHSLPDVQPGSKQASDQYWSMAWELGIPKL